MIERKDSRREQRPGKTGDDLLKDAMRNPGVAEMMKVYGELEDVMQGTAPYVAAMEERHVLLVSTSSDE